MCKMCRAIEPDEDDVLRSRNSPQFALVKASRATADRDYQRPLFDVRISLHRH